MTTLEFVKSHESEESLMLVLDDLPAKKVMAAWTLYASPDVCAITIGDRPLRKKESLRDVLQAMWLKMNVDIDKLTGIAGLPYQIVYESFHRLVAAQLIYPDCTLPAYARRLLRSEINAYRINLVPRSARPALAASSPNATSTTPTPA